MGEKRVKIFHDITARRWNDIINAVNSRRPEDSIYPPLKLHEAIRFAEEKHRAQNSKGTDIAYIIHPMEVLQILMGKDAV